MPGAQGISEWSHFSRGENRPLRTVTANAAATAQRSPLATSNGVSPSNGATDPGFQLYSSHNPESQHGAAEAAGPSRTLVQLSMHGAGNRRLMPHYGRPARAAQQPMHSHRVPRVSTDDSSSHSIMYQADHSWTLASPQAGCSADDEHGGVLRSASQWDEDLSDSGSTSSSGTDATPDGSVAPFLAQIGMGATEYANASLGPSMLANGMSMPHNSFRPPSGIMAGVQGGGLPSFSPPPPSGRSEGQEALRFRTNSNSTPSRSSVGGIGSAVGSSKAAESPPQTADAGGGGGLTSLFAFYRQQAEEGGESSPVHGRAVLPARPHRPLQQAGLTQLGLAGGGSPPSGDGAGTAKNNSVQPPGADAPFNVDFRSDLPYIAAASSGGQAVACHHPFVCELTSHSRLWPREHAPEHGAQVPKGSNNSGRPSKSPRYLFSSQAADQTPLSSPVSLHPPPANMRPATSQKLPPGNPLKQAPTEEGLSSPARLPSLHSPTR